MAKFLERLSENQRLRLVLVVTIVVLAALLRFYRLGEWSFWVEELHQLGDASGPLANILASPRPLSYLLVRLSFNIFGISEWSGRLFPAMVGVATVPLVYAATDKILDSRTGILAAALLAINPWHIYWSQNTRFYSLLAFFYLLSLLSLYVGLETDRWHYVLTSFLITILAVATQTTAALLVPIYLLFFLVAKLLSPELPSGYRWRYFSLFLFGSLVLYVLFEIGRVVVLEQATFIQKLYSLFVRTSTTPQTNSGSPYNLFSSTIMYIGVPISVLASSGGLLLIRQKHRAGILLSLGAGLPLIVFTLLTPFVRTSNRYVFMALPLWIILGASGLNSLYVQMVEKGRAWPCLALLGGMLLLLVRDPFVEDVLFFLAGSALLRVLIGGLIVVLILMLVLVEHVSESRNGLTWSILLITAFVLWLHPLVVDILYFSFQDGHRDRWREAGEVIRKHEAEGDELVTYSPLEARYYTGLPVRDLNNVDLKSVLEGQPRVWFIEDWQVSVRLGEAYSKWSAAHCELVSSHDHFVAGRNWPLRVFLCTPPAK